MMKWSPWLRHCNSPKLCYYAVYLWHCGSNRSKRGNQYSTIKLKLASVRWYHRRFLGRTIDLSPRLRILLQGIKRQSNPTTKKQPITPAFLRLLRRSLNLSDPRQRLLWGSVLLGYFFLLRRSEYLKIGSTRSFYCLKSSNALFTNEKGSPADPRKATAVTIGLEGSKNDQFGRGAWRTMHKSGDRCLCPVRALHHIFAARRALKMSSHRYLCLDLDAKTVSQALKNTAASIGVSPSNYSTHSLRSGGATALLSGKADSLSIKLLGRWMSSCFEEYPLQSAASTVDLSRRMV